MDLATILAELESLLNRPMLFDEREVGPRAAAIDFLRFAAGSIRAYERSHGVASTTQHLYAEATRLEHALREVDRAFFEKIRDDIRSGRLVGSRLRRFCDRFTSYEPHRDTHLHVGLDPLDTLVAGVLHSTPPPQPTGPLEPGMVAFQPSPMSVVLELVDQTPMGADDVFYDLGSGLGDIALMVHLLTGVRTYGVEIDPGLCTYAQDQATALGLSGIMFINADVRSVAAPKRWHTSSVHADRGRYSVARERQPASGGPISVSRVSKPGRVGRALLLVAGQDLSCLFLHPGHERRRLENSHGRSVAQNPTRRPFQV